MNITTRGFLHVTYKLYHHLNILNGEEKSTCLNVFLSIMKYAWKKNGYKAQLRHETIAKDTGLCRATVKTAISKLVKLNIISDIRGRSGKTYIVNDTFLKAENTYDSHNTAISKPQIAKHLASDSQTLATLEETIYINNIGKIVKRLAGDKEKIINELSTLPIEELKADKSNPYYCKLAIEKKEESGKSYVSPDKILSALSNLKNQRKKANPFYKAKVEYNKRNNLNWKGEPKNDK
jgi:predicted transcriptional regulator